MSFTCIPKTSDVITHIQILRFMIYFVSPWTFFCIHEIFRSLKTIRASEGSSTSQTRFFAAFKLLPFYFLFITFFYVSIWVRLLSSIHNHASLISTDITRKMKTRPNNVKFFLFSSNYAFHCKKSWMNEPVKQMHCQKSGASFLLLWRSCLKSYKDMCQKWRFRNKSLIMTVDEKMLRLMNMRCKCQEFLHFRKVTWFQGDDEIYYVFYFVVNVTILIAITIVV